MLKYLLTIKATFHFIRPRDGVVIDPSPPEEIVGNFRNTLFTGMLIFADGRRQEVNGRFIRAHFSGRPVGLPAWVTECFLEGLESVPEGTELWWDEPE